MPIIYSLVTRGLTVLAEYTDSGGNFTTVSRRILERVPAADTKATFAADKYVFHVVVQNGITYMCMADDQMPRRLTFAFLETVRQRFVGSYGDRPKTAVAFEMNEDFKKVLQSQMDYYNRSPEADRLGQLRSKVDDARETMAQNIQLVQDRGEKINIVVEKTETLVQSSHKFKSGSAALKRSMWWKNVKIWIIIAIVIALIIFFIVVGACGGFQFQNCGGGGGGGGH